VCVCVCVSVCVCVCVCVCVGSPQTKDEAGKRKELLKRKVPHELIYIVP